MSALSVIGTAASLGVVHVLTGPDHLSALATLCASESTRASFVLGLQWGVGHSAGLLLVGGIFIAITTQNDANDSIEVPESVSKVFEYLVGVFMILLGCFGIRRAVLKKRRAEAAKDCDAQDEEHGTSVSPQELLPHLQGVPPSSTDDGIFHQEDNQDTNDDGDELDGAHDSLVDPPAPLPLYRRLCCRPCCTTNSFLSLVAGLIHGLAGPGGVLGVLPAIQIRDPLLGTIYLTTFCLCSTLTMSCFAAAYGRLFAKRIGWEFRIECFSASLSLLVGILWLILIGTGTMEQIFG